MASAGQGYAASDDLVSLRRRLHAYPELRFDETRTSTTLRSELEGPADELLVGLAGTGLLARVVGRLPGPDVLVRCDIDAYPVQDSKDVAYRSRNAGVSHACGHDVHMAVGVGLVRILAANRPACGSVTVVFQPAEETPFGETSGAAAMIACAELRDREFNAVLGLHCWPQLTAGTVGAEPKIAMAAKDAFEVRLTGVAAHAATPASGRDALVAGCAMVCDLHLAVSRRQNASELAAFNIGTIAGGSSQSVLAEDVVITGTLRTHREELRARLRQVIEDVVDGTARQHDLTATLTWANEMPAVVNDAALLELARRTLGGEVTFAELGDAPMTSDDFALYRELAPTLYLKLGVARPGGHAAAPLHSPSFDVDERSIRVGVSALSQLCSAILSGETTEGHG